MGETREVVLVGAGPAGAAAALGLARAGVPGVLVLERQALPRDKACAGGLGPKARAELQRLGLWEQVAARAYPISGVRLVSPGGREAVAAGRASAHVLRRRVLDGLLVEAARAAGVEVHTRCKAERLLWRAGRVVGVRAAGQDLEAGWVLLAHGATGHLGVAAEPRPRRLLQTCLGWYEDLALRPNTVEMLWDEELAPHYGWLFPESDRVANLGVCIAAERLGRRSVRALFARFLERQFGPRVRAARQVGGWLSHPISVSTRVRPAAPPGCLALGEAARLVNPATGEGIAQALTSGRLAAEALLAMRAGLPEREAVRRYARGLSRELQLGFLLGEAFMRLGVPALDVVVGLARSRWLGGLTSDAMAKM
ncbi:MAG TPA: NAD(P)/FAD-dependent oxidoreductase [Myxococcota bacterium]|nr:NAD(P)/FAD-dependent oxidoreductase [Myxococcota bacterium]HRY91949.1 NAD(P)/FAD-dependent oxidoreductase [Myxococcota bacterium]HSA20680.1 NAD(P)/FAD-dependent oxidoreductase [Myxococcota bacterium]